MVVVVCFQKNEAESVDLTEKLLSSKLWVLILPCLSQIRSMRKCNV